MAISASKTTQLSRNKDSKKYTLKAEFTESSTSSANNYSKVTCKATLSSSEAGFASSGGTLYIYWHDNKNDTDVLVNSKSVTQGGTTHGTPTTSGTITVYHKADGSLSGYAKAKWDKTSSNDYAPNDGTVSTDTTALTKFNVYPKIATAPNFTDDEKPTMTWTRYNSNYWQRAKMEVNGDYSFIVRDVGKTATSCTFTLTDEEIDKLLDAAGDNDTLPVRFTICAMSVEHGTEANELSASYLDRTMTVTPKGKIGKDGQWKRVQIYFGDGTWKRCTPYIGKDGQWKRVK